MKNHYSTLIKVCWVTLVCYLAFKVFGFEAVNNTYTYKDFCGFVDNNLIVKMIMASWFCLGSNYFIVSILLDKKILDKNILIWLVPLLIFKSIISWYIITISITIDFLYLVLIPILSKQNLLKIIIVNVLVIVYQVLSIYITDMRFDFNYGNSFLTQSVSMQDYYIMIIIHYLYYFKRKEV